MSEYDAVADVPTWTLLRNTLYPVTPTLSVDALQERFTCDEDMAEAERLLGVEGGVRSEETITVRLKLVVWIRTPAVALTMTG